MPLASGNSHRFENIDVLRGIAALFVVWLHSAEVFIALRGIAAFGSETYNIARDLSFGRLGVVAFFAISGYVIVPTVIGERYVGTRDFLIKRFFRLFPPFWLSMAVAVYAVWYIFDRHVTGPIVVANLSMIPIEWGEPQIMGHYWTLEVELAFYLLVLLFFWFGVLHRPQSIAWFVLIVTIAWPILNKNSYGKLIVDRNLVWSVLSYFLSVMFWGAMIRARQFRPKVAKAWRTHLREDWPFLLVTVLVFGRPILALLFGSVHQEDWRGTLLGLLLFLAFTRIPAHHAKPFVWIGTISYSLYLFHPAVFYPMFRWVSTHEAWSHAPLIVYIAASMLTSILVASLVYRWVEAPSNAMARRIVRRLRERERVESAPSESHVASHVS